VGGIDGMQVASEPAHRADPEVDGDRLDPLRLTRPRRRQLDRDGRGAVGVQVGDEVRQDLAMTAELEAQPATQPQIVFEMPGQRAHDAAPLGQGCAIVRSRSTSTRA
jgi:hypothetical protein